ncbi:MAG: hypothetical protein A2528_03195 [Candidatus Staskawiczbacteria bacterium RIFOXYD2_FULL_37_9]|uniref:Uncharacterized protein n=1 Tax=Candidatus Staskawiczbacteria bacterium RIFOXYB1_FULL_37_44 TaxID=1802223 RepID=A0A1G2IY10_9BACT|nr:MAG: hypothetical protein A2358_00785 [Candidatus Staskawiczbacteria bacterium RIFOXYB1_FULL_37_44]OGZ84488.1 MAG: hypothetical protein A2416_03060 [Candidatus Staskawiczbacteria bacterium RIFOXYC1_FULL_37_52]OGZ89229.1 MAG: hypothetical protein A2444_01855 [Candidatus Staskawiczbacteria bacterium RIFOXYC2_FULL_37_19]OGZ89947.1 MAG: hypothetical protein A2581_04105 [Candidatus Staskawiczbacteria bacterium RIFOXYD1_FULL_37_110]OGZ94491.1 MAG: hypothetical protein A2528_03195 [Candidatus Stask
MEVESKEQIIKRRKEIEQDIVDMLSGAESDFTLENVKEVIYNEESQDDLMKAISMFDTGKIPEELENILELTNDAWNYFPHKTLKGLSPAEMMLKYEKEDKKTKPIKILKSKKFTAKQKDLLWSGDGKGPYSQANLTKQIRILDDSVSRVFLIVEAEINPTTFEIIKNNRHDNEFKNNVMIQQLLDRAEYRGPQFGYVVAAFEEEYKDNEVLARAEQALKYTQESIIKMHNYVIHKYL